MQAVRPPKLNAFARPQSVCVLGQLFHQLLHLLTQRHRRQVKRHWLVAVRLQVAAQKHDIYAWFIKRVTRFYEKCQMKRSCKHLHEHLRFTHHSRVKAGRGYHVICWVARFLLTCWRVSWFWGECCWCIVDRTKCGNQEQQASYIKYGYSRELHHTSREPRDLL